MSLEKRIEALESEVKSIRGTGKGWKIECEGSLEIQSNGFIPKMASSVEKHLEALTALVGPCFKVENGQVFIKNAFIEKESIQSAKYDLTLIIARDESGDEGLAQALEKAAKTGVVAGCVAALKDAEAVELATKETAQNQAADNKGFEIKKEGSFIMRDTPTSKCIEILDSEGVIRVRI